RATASSTWSPPPTPSADLPAEGGSPRTVQVRGLRVWGLRATEDKRRRARRLALGRVDGLGGLREDLEEVAHDAEVDQLEDRGLLGLVDRHDRLGGLHPGPVLDRTRDSARDVQLRRDLLAGLADLAGVRV